MSSLDELRSVRLEKLQKLRDAGMNPYPAKVSRDYSLKEIKDSFDSLSQEGKALSIVGRIMTIRGQGAILFAVLFDGTERFQAVFKKDEIDEKLFILFTDAIDMGDFISVTG